MSTASQNKTGFIYQIRVTSQEETRTAYVTMDKFTIGSLPNLPVVIHEKSVDKKHLTVSCVGSQIWITDQQSANGTQINRKVIPTNIPYHYCPGDSITLGNTEHLLQIRVFSPFVDTDLEPNRLLTEAKSEYETLQAKAREEAEGLRTKIKEEADSLRTKIKQEADGLLTKAKVDAEALRANARHQAEEIVQIAKEKSENLLKSAEKNIDKRQDGREKEKSESRALAQAHAEAEVAKVMVVPPVKFDGKVSLLLQLVRGIPLGSRIDGSNLGVDMCGQFFGGNRL